MRENTFAPSSPMNRNKTLASSMARKMPYNRVPAAPRTGRDRAAVPEPAGPPRITAAVALPGMPSARVGTIAPPVAALLAASGPGHPLDGALGRTPPAVVGPSLGLVVADHRRHGAAFGGQHAHEDADPAGPAEWRSFTRRKSSSVTAGFNADMAATAILSRPRWLGLAEELGDGETARSARE